MPASISGITSCSAGDRQLAAAAGVERDAELCRLRRGGDREHALGAARELDRRGELAVAASIERGIDAFRRNLAQALGRPSP